MAEANPRQSGGTCKRCPRCRRDVPLVGWTRSRGTADGLQGWCKECCNRATREVMRRARHELIHEMGGACVRCGFSDVRALQIDHIHGGGSADPLRRQQANKVWRDFVRANRHLFQLLCANCNTIKRIENEEHGNAGRRRQLPAMTAEEYIPSPGRTPKLRQWYEQASDEEVAAAQAKAQAARKHKKGK